ncbi:CaiB/BaiF CoA transferase family protein [Sphingosinicella sp.]|uniref:CaiB/BaiF CoA transferase family protein n=1 Tax=Sphingosinicella sp. TaxID=1917971 RepID=UPI0035B10A3C
MRPLENVLVVSLEQAIAAPFCTRQLADLGARIIKIERPGGGDFARGYDERARGMSSHFVWVNRSKESVTLDLKIAGDLQALRGLLCRADVFVQNLAPGVTSRLGLDHGTLAARNPGLIVCDISGYGEGGPDEQRKAYDLLIQAESGFLSLTGTGSEPCKAGISIADIAAGMYAYSNILSALLERQKTGRGRRVDISMLEAMAEWMSFPLYYALDGASPPARSGADHATIFPYGRFAVADGEIVLAVQNDWEWAALCTKVLRQAALEKDPRFKTNSLRVMNRAALKAIISGTVGSLSLEEVERRLAEARIAYAPINTMTDLWEHRQLKARGRWRQLETPVGMLPCLLAPGQVDMHISSVPEKGAHTSAVLQEFGLGPFGV